MMAYSKQLEDRGGVPMEPTVTPTPPKSPQDFKLAHFLDRIDRSVAEVRDDAKVGGLLRDAAHQSDVATLQPEVAVLQPDVARPGLHQMADSDLGELIRPRVSRGLVLFLIVCSIGVGATLAWKFYGDAARATIATSQVPEPASVPPAAPAAPQATASPELQQLKEDLAQVKQELEQLKEMSSALAGLRQSVDQLSGSQQQIAGKIAKLSTQPASPPRPAPAPKPLTPPSASKPLTPSQAEAR
jgi:hypothetical protein